MDKFELNKLIDKYESPFEQLYKEKEKLDKSFNHNKVTNYYCSECGNPIDELGKNIPRKRLSKWSFMNAKPYMGNCCNPY